MAGLWMLLVMAVASATAAALPALAQEVSPGQRYGRSVEGQQDASWLGVAPDGEARPSEAGTAVGHGGNFWVARGKKDAEGSRSYYWGPNQSLWGGEVYHRGGPVLSSSPYVGEEGQRSGWESNPSLWGKRDAQGPFWAARGKRQGRDPFWVSRGRRTPAEAYAALQQEQQQQQQLWPAERPAASVAQESGEEQVWSSEIKREDGSGGPFWISRGKRPELGGGGAASQLASLWAVRGRKSGAANTFWAARGRRNGGESTTGPYWIARGKKEDGNSPTAAGPYWIARGKKSNDDEAVFWAARGKKDPPTWRAGRGRREDAHHHSFWIARGKRNGRIASPTTTKDDDDNNDNNNEEEEEEEEEVTQKASNHFLKEFTSLAEQ